MSIRIFLANLYLAIEGIFRRCPGTTPCGFLGRSIKMHRGIRGSASCEEVCGFFLDSSLKCGGCSNEFDISLQLVNVTSSEDQSLITKSRQRWESIVVGDVADARVTRFFRNVVPRPCDYPFQIDDVYVCLRFEVMDEFFATASALVVRIRNDIPIIGEIVIDVDFVKSINGTAPSFLEDLILRQFGITLGE